LTGRALRELARALETILDSMEMDADGHVFFTNERGRLTPQQRARRARRAVARLSTYIRESEECEQP
jgi:hypothetical protein